MTLQSRGTREDYARNAFIASRTCLFVRGSIATSCTNAPERFIERMISTGQR